MSSPERDTQIEKGRVAGDFVIADSAAQRRGAVRLTAARGSIRVAFESLDLGWTYDDVERYLLGAPSFQAMVLRLGGDQRGMLQGLIMGFALVAVEQSRAAGVVPKADLEAAERRVAELEAAIESLKDAEKAWAEYEKLVGDTSKVEAKEAFIAGFAAGRAARGVKGPTNGGNE